MAGASAADVRSILSLPNPSTPGPSQPRKPSNAGERARKPEGISRELYSLIGPSAPSLAAQFVKPRLKQKPNFGSGGRVKWEWRPFKNGARADSMRLHHWAKTGTDPEADYPFAKYNIQPISFVYSQDEYTRLLEDQEWTKEETDYLFELVREYDQRWHIVHDRYEYIGGSERSLEDLKDRYFTVCRKLVKNRPWAGDEASKSQLLSSLQFDKEREITRKRYIASLESRTPQQKAEEDALYVELKRLEQSERRFKRERDELLRTLLGIESGLSELPLDEEGIATGPPDTKRRKKGNHTAEPDTPISATPSSNVISLGQPQPRKAQTAKSAAYDALHFIYRTEVPPTTTSTTKASHQAAYLRSYKLPQPKITSAAKVAQVLGEIGISHGRLVMPTRDNCVQLESLLEAATALVETKKVVDKVEQDIRVLKARLGKRESEGAEDSFGTGEAAPTPMDVDEVEAEADGRAQSVVSTRSARSVRSRKQSRRSMSISSVDTSAAGASRRQKRQRD
ncbi:hypothetical protein IEO21_00800 [Rhodonia placenta]|uniref:SWR1-complex protein 4 n=2 Tax=Rhodonia placenta TaxID=104341 RepID=A0A1X6MUZ1_9APHY|nr:hypothetical protein POSPLADRAFT_1147273 [Postia placenta MAD-698-R-SB12]KAF9821192.1 hypothetical protein IEO21_00800 [Postia placenta]OSX60201.1 hypothetical protein POSPLADRAFT_1147273 [Postia placenta MAD-698-R-SB12]